jgi:hypothetical protein
LPFDGNGDGVTIPESACLHPTELPPYVLWGRHILAPNIAFQTETRAAPRMLL